MSIDPRHLTALRDELLLGTGLGFLVLGVGGRVVMRAIALVTGAPSALTAGGTASVLAAGTAAGIGGALLHLLSRVVAARAAGSRAGVRIALFATLLGLVTVRGLHGTPPGPAAAFWPLVLVYGALLDRAVARRARSRPPSAPPAALPAR